MGSTSSWRGFIMFALLGVAVAFNITATNSTEPENTTTTTTTTPMPRPRIYSDLGALKLSARDVVFEAMEEEDEVKLDGEADPTCSAFNLCRGQNAGKQARLDLEERLVKAIDAQGGAIELLRQTVGGDVQKLESRVDGQQLAIDANTKAAARVAGDIKTTAAKVAANERAIASNKASQRNLATKAYAAGQGAAAKTKARQGLTNMCKVFGGTWDDRTNSCKIKKGLTPTMYANSCEEARATGTPRGATYVMQHFTKQVKRVYCDGKGWELIHKIKGSSDYFKYDSDTWKTSTPYRQNTFNEDWGENVKGYGYSEQRCRNIELRWRDPGDGYKWTWKTPKGWSTTKSAKSYFSTARTIEESRSQGIYNNQEWTSAKGRFTSQTGIQAVAVGRCLGNVCGRWMLAFNNENYWGSSDAGGGWGLRSRNSAKSAGDWRSCCHRILGKRRAFDANMYCKY